MRVWVKKDLTPEKFYAICKKFNKLGAKIIGGCCETTPAHIRQLSRLV